jgi:hypothetical protein
LLDDRSTAYLCDALDFIIVRPSPDPKSKPGFDRGLLLAKGNLKIDLSTHDNGVQSSTFRLPRAQHAINIALSSPDKRHSEFDLQVAARFNTQATLNLSTPGNGVQSSTFRLPRAQHAINIALSTSDNGVQSSTFRLPLAEKRATRKLWF